MKTLDLSPPKGSSKLDLERRALLIQMGGYTLNGDERIYSSTGRAHVESVTAREACQQRMAAAVAVRLAR